MHVESSHCTSQYMQASSCFDCGLSSMYGPGKQFYPQNSTIERVATIPGRGKFPKQQSNRPFRLRISLTYLSATKPNSPHDWYVRWSNPILYDGNCPRKEDNRPKTAHQRIGTSVSLLLHLVRAAGASQVPTVHSQECAPEKKPSVQYSCALARPIHRTQVPAGHGNHR